MADDTKKVSLDTNIGWGWIIMAHILTACAVKIAFFS